MRTSDITRKTAETDITLSFSIDGSGKSRINTGCGFLDHMLTLFAKHGRFDLNVTCKGDTNVDFHHTVEDVGITLGRAFAQSLGNKKGINRYGSAVVPMDEALILSAVDLSGRAFLNYDLKPPTEKIGDFDTELSQEFWLGFIRSAECTLHIRQFSGCNSHHIIEGAFKSVARALKQAAAIDPDFSDDILSTKGVL